MRAFYYFLIANVLAALFAPIQDCDEVFNYWEPTHYLSHGYGLQTWEYSPTYAIRSWLYVLAHAMIGNVASLLPGSSKVTEFYFIRCTLAAICTLSQTKLHQSITKHLNSRIGFFYMISMISSPGMYHSSASFLPSSFAMYMNMFGLASFMNRRTDKKLFCGIIWFSIGSVLGWPFSMALCVPLIARDIVIILTSQKIDISGTIRNLLQEVSISIIVLLAEIFVSSLLYKHFVIVPLNIVVYNIFGGPGRGPEIYGVEPWHFYIRNLLLNFNIWFILALISIPLSLIQQLWIRKERLNASSMQSFLFMTPFYMWLVIFSLQGHKEERFMYPAYPCLSINAAVSVHTVLSILGSYNPQKYTQKLFGRIKLAFVVILLIGSVNIGLMRIYGIYTAYSAPLNIYNSLSVVGAYGDTICFGKDWYRFPSSYHLPNNMNAKFIKSEFNGLLPGEFPKMHATGGWRSGTWLVPSGMNDQNLEDMGKYVKLHDCSFLIDTYYPKNIPSILEPHYLLDHDNWSEISCADFLDSSETSLLGRMLWLPNSPSFIPGQLRNIWNKWVARKWAKHCLLKYNHVISDKPARLSNS